MYFRESMWYPEIDPFNYVNERAMVHEEYMDGRAPYRARLIASDNTP
jgi:hypothetical protein